MKLFVKEIIVPVIFVFSFAFSVYLNIWLSEFSAEGNFNQYVMHKVDLSFSNILINLFKPYLLVH